MYNILQYNELWPDFEEHLGEGEHFYDFGCVGRKFSKREYPEIHKEYYNRLKQTMLDRLDITFFPETDPLNEGRIWARTYLGECVSDPKTNDTDNVCPLLYQTIDYSNHNKKEFDLKKILISNNYFTELNGRLRMKEGNNLINNHNDFFWDKK